MKAVILAAGIGNRLGDLGKHIPKCLLSLGEETILERNIRLLVDEGIKKEEIVIVIGGKGEVWSRENQERIKTMHGNVIINDENVEKNQAYSFFIGTQTIETDVVCIDGDSVFDKKVLHKLIASSYASCLMTRLVPSQERRMRVTVIDGRVINFGKDLASERVYTPLLKLSSAFLKELKKELTLQPDFYFATSIDAAIKTVCTKNLLFNVSIEDDSEEKDLFININTPEEYERARKTFGKGRVPFIAFMFGYTAVGKSTTAQKIARLSHTDIFHSAVIRKELDLSPKTPEEADKFFNWENNMRQEVDKKVYTLLAEKALESVKKGRNVVLDAGYFFYWQRQLIYEKVKNIPVEIVAIKVFCNDEDEIKRRLTERAKRFNDNPLNETPSWNTYLATKKVTESLEKDQSQEKRLHIIGYDSLSHTSFIPQEASEAIQDINGILKEQEKSHV